jgi:hypothetical protein
MDRVEESRRESARIRVCLQCPIREPREERELSDLWRRGPGLTAAIRAQVKAAINVALGARLSELNSQLVVP